jgi:hypothetical protein
MVADAAQQVLPFPTTDARPVRGVSWVLTWAAAVAVLCWAAIILLSFGYQLAAEQALSRAVTAGLHEAAQDRATRHTVEQTVLRRLNERGYPTQQATVMLLRGGTPISGAVRSAPNDQLSASISIPNDALLPSWLVRIGVSRDSAIAVTSARQATQN